MEVLYLWELPLRQRVGTPKEKETKREWTTSTREGEIIHMSRTQVDRVDEARVSHQDRHKHEAPSQKGTSTKTKRRRGHTIERRKNNNSRETEWTMLG